MGEAAPLAVFAFGALLFSALTVQYWRERRTRRSKSAALPLFTLVCAAAFVDNLLWDVLVSTDAGLRLGFALGAVREVATGLLPPLILHLTLEAERRRWRAPLALLYAAAAALALLRAAQTMPSEWLYRTPAALFAVAAALGLAALATSRRDRTPTERAHRRWNAAILLLFGACAAANLAGWGAALGQAPDYLVLAFFSVTLYYRERLAFFDVLVKLGVFAAVGIAAVALWLAVAPSPYAGLALAFWLAGAWVYPWVARAVDRRWLRRPYTAAGAERQFIHDVQGAADEADLAASAEATLRVIFRSAASVRFDGAAPESAEGLSAGPIALAPRPDRIPFLSDDRRLLQSLAGTLEVVLENVRFRVERRRQQEREQQLRLLATRAELKALRAQINPHFLFNSLSVIAGLIQSQPELADETIEQLAQVFRYTLRKSENEWAPLAEEVEFVTAYLRIERARFGERLRVEISVAPEAAIVPVPAMCVQPLIENAVKHGVSATPGPGSVLLRASVANGELRIEVEDCGPGFPPGFRLDNGIEGHGLRNVAERLRGYYGAGARLACENGPRGARVTLVLPTVAATGSAVA